MYACYLTGLVKGAGTFSTSRTTSSPVLHVLPVAAHPPSPRRYLLVFVVLKTCETMFKKVSLRFDKRNNKY